MSISNHASNDLDLFKVPPVPKSSSQQLSKEPESSAVQNEDSIRPDQAMENADTHTNISNNPDDPDPLTNMVAPMDTDKLDDEIARAIQQLHQDTNYEKTLKLAKPARILIHQPHLWTPISMTHSHQKLTKMQTNQKTKTPISIQTDNNHNNQTQPDPEPQNTLMETDNQHQPPNIQI